MTTSHKQPSAYGLHPVTSLLQQTPERVREIFVQSGRDDAPLQRILKMAHQADIKVQTTSRAALDRMAEGGVHQGIVAHLVSSERYTEADLMQLLDQLQQPPFLLILDGVQDPHNLGACLRSANAAGVHAVIVPKDKASTLTPIAYKAASGAADITPLIAVTNLARTMEKLKERGIWLYGASDAATKTLYNADLRGAIAWVLGAEGEGLRRLTRDTCDALFSIPMHGTVSSLNVSVATGICLFEAVRQRTAL
jgi:23S rRNA (guanosine2251-2'-O)-methyltransferase